MWILWDVGNVGKLKVEWNFRFSGAVKIIEIRKILNNVV